MKKSIYSTWLAKNIKATYIHVNKSLKIDQSGLITELSWGEMNKLAEAYKGANRIHKPLYLLFWMDCKNNKQNNWNLI